MSRVAMPFDGLDGELSEVLHELAFEPKTSLLRVRSRRDASPVPTSKLDLVSSAPFLRSIERHILQAHRERVASLLRDACRRRLLEESPLRHRLIRENNRHSRTAHMPRERWSAEVASESACGSTRANVADGIRVLESCVSGDVTSRPSVADMAVASLRLVPCDVARIYIAIDLVARQQPKGAIVTLKTLLRQHPSDWIASHVHETLGLAFWAAGDRRSSLDAYRSAARGREPRVAPALNWLVTALELGRASDALESAHWIEQLGACDHPSIDEFRESVRACREQHGWTPSKQARDGIATIQDRLGSTARRVTDVIR